MSAISGTQISLFDPAFQDSIPPFIEEIMQHGADIAASLSGGKDSDAMGRYLAKSHQARGWQGKLFGLFSDLGRIEWAGVSEHLHSICAELKLPLIKLFPKRSMVDEWQQRYENIKNKQEDKPFWSSAASRFCTDRGKAQTSNQFFRGSTQLSATISVAHIDDDTKSRSEKPFWSSAASRFCTKHEKVQPSDIYLRAYDFIVCAIGLRAEESTNRAKKPRYQVRQEITTSYLSTPADFYKVGQRSIKLKWNNLLGLNLLHQCPLWITFFTQEAFNAFQTVYKSAAEHYERWAEFAFQCWLKSGRKGRFAITWHPILHWSLEEVWNYNGTSAKDVARRTALFLAGKIKQATAGFPCHWAYLTGNSRLSCALCVLASAGDLLNGARYNPWTWAELALMELVGGWGFQQNRWLSSFSETVLSVSLEEHKHLLQTLYEIERVDRWSRQYCLTLLTQLPPDLTQFWQYTAFVGIARLIDAYWRTATAEVTTSEAQSVAS